MFLSNITFINKYTKQYLNISNIILFKYIYNNNNIYNNKYINRYYLYFIL